jgi:hypothetical protein
MGYALHFDRENEVLLVAIDGELTRDSYLAAYDGIVAFMRSHGPCSAIVDFTRVDRFDLSADFAREIATMRPAIPPGKQRVVIAPQAVVYGTARMVAALRAGRGAEMTVVRSLTEALAALGLSKPSFVSVQ